MKSINLALICASLLSALLPTKPLRAEGGIITDGSLGAAQSLTGQQVTIPQNLGKTVGNNLFHSFAEFNVQNGQAVTFTENTANTLANVISRVTGGAQSDINGLIRSTPGGHANFYLINPAGIVFGQNAQLDVAGAFHASTAQQLQLSDGGVFSANSARGSSLSSMEPSQFGFLATSPSNNGLLQVQGAQLDVKNAQTLDLVGGQIKVEQATLNAPGGEIRLVAMQGTGAVGLQANNGVLPLPEAPPSASNAGNIDVQDAFIKTTGDGGGRIGVWGGEVRVAAQDPALAQGIDALNTGATNAALSEGIEMKTYHLTLDGARVRTEAKDSGNAGNVSVYAAQDLNLQKGGRIHNMADVNSTGNTGNVNLQVGRDLVLDGQDRPANILSAVRVWAFENSLGNAGDINILTGRNLYVKNGADISKRNGSGAVGDIGNVSVNALDNIFVDGTIETNANGGDSHSKPGSVNVTANGDITLAKGAQIDSYTVSNRDAGSVNVHTGGNLISEGDIQSFTSNNDGRAGKVVVDAAGDIVVIGDGRYGKIASYAYPGKTTNGLPNSVSVTAGGNLELHNIAEIKSYTFNDVGESGNVDIAVNGNVTVDSGSSILSSSFQKSGELYGAVQSGSGGHIKLFTGGNFILNNATFQTITSTDAGAGDITIEVKGETNLSDNAVIASDSISNNGSVSGNAGNVSFIAHNNVSISNSMISSVTASSGQGGNIDMNVSGNLLLEDDGKAKLSGIYADSELPTDGVLPVNGKIGNAGNINIQVKGDIRLSGVNISTTTSGPGQAGQIHVSSGRDILVEGNDAIISGFKSHSGVPQNAALPFNGKLGDAGDIVVQAQGDIKFIKGGISSSTYGSGAAANVDVTANNISLSDGSGIISASGGADSSGQTGQIHITSKNAIALRNRSYIFNTNYAVLSEAAAKAIIPGSISLFAKHVLVDNSGIYTNAMGNGASGNISLSAQDVRLIKGSGINTAAAGDLSAGKVNMTAANLKLIGGSFISTRANGNGAGGDIYLSVKEGVNLKNESTIETTSFGNGQAGNLKLTANNIQLLNKSGILTNAAGNGNAGNANFFVNDMSLAGGSFISSSASGSGAAGNINVNFANKLLMQNKSNILTSANTGNGGAININGGRFFSLRDSNVFTSVTSGQGNGGDITVKSDVMLMDNVRIAANADSGHGGNINLLPTALIQAADNILHIGKTKTLNMPKYNVIQAVSASGVNGVTRVTQPQLNLSGAISNLGNPLFDSSVINPDFCNLGAGSTLTRKGNGGLLPKASELSF